MTLHHDSREEQTGERSHEAYMLQSGPTVFEG